MKLGKVIGCIGFVIGLVGPVLFYTSPPPFFQAFFVCPWCPYIVIFPSSTLTWVGVGLRWGLACGLLFALIGFVIGWTMAKVGRLHGAGGQKVFC
jgi:hypothetical protein